MLVIVAQLNLGIRTVSHTWSKSISVYNDPKIDQVAQSQKMDKCSIVQFSSMRTYQIIVHTPNTEPFDCERVEEGLLGVIGI